MATQYAICAVGVTAGAPIALTAGVARTCIELPTSSTAGLTVIGLELSFSHTAASSCTVEWGTYTTTGTGTSATPIKYGTGQGVAANTGTIKINDSVEPSGFATATLPTWIIPLPGMYSVLYPMGREMFQPASVNRALRLTAVAAGNVRINLYFEQ